MGLVTLVSPWQIALSTLENLVLSLRIWKNYEEGMKKMIVQQDVEYTKESRVSRVHKVEKEAFI